MMSPPPVVPSSPRQVVLFTGHRMDSPDRARPRFPASMEAAAAAAIGATLDELGAGSADLALCQAAAGGDLLFLEASLRRGLRCEVLLPFDEPRFMRSSVLPSLHGQAWRSRWLALKPRLAAAPRILPALHENATATADPFERCNLWLLDTALAWGPSRLKMVCLWNGARGDGPGGTQHMMAEAQRRGGEVRWIDTRKLGS